MGLVAEDVMLETHEGEDVIVVLFRREETRGFGPLYGFRMQVVEPEEEFRNLSEHTSWKERRRVGPALSWTA